MKNEYKETFLRELIRSTFDSDGNALVVFYANSLCEILSNIKDRSTEDYFSKDDIRKIFDKLFENTKVLIDEREADEKGEK